MKKILSAQSRVKLYFYIGDGGPSPDVIAITERPYLISGYIYDHNEGADKFTNWIKVDDYVNMAFNKEDVIEVV